MNTTKEDFIKLPWTEADVGLRYKEFIEGNKKLKLVEFSIGFVEEEWCKKGHFGYVIEGKFKIDFNGKRLNYSTGDEILIEAGDKNKHKLIIENDDYANLILIEEIN